MIIFLLVIGILLVVLNVKVLKKEEKSFKKVFHSTEENMEEFEVKLGEARREFSEAILKLQREIIDMKKYMDGINSLSHLVTESPKDIEKDKDNLVMEEVKKNDIVSVSEKHAELDKKDKDTEYKNSNSVKIDEINELLSKGLSIEEVGAKLGIGKGEILLIKELYLK